MRSVGPTIPLQKSWKHLPHRSKQYLSQAHFHNYCSKASGTLRFEHEFLNLLVAIAGRVQDG
eukprot:scaffold401153_cov24-Attheya_sp.AAC.1